MILSHERASNARSTELRRGEGGKGKERERKEEEGGADEEDECGGWKVELGGEIYTH